MTNQITQLPQTPEFKVFGKLNAIGSAWGIGTELITRILVGNIHIIKHIIGKGSKTSHKIPSENFGRVARFLITMLILYC